MYTKHFEKGLTVDIGEFKVPVPDPPEEREMIGYYKPIAQQKFERFEMPDLKTMNQADLENLAERAWHIRENGLYMLIKGEPIYIPGPLWMFINFWTTTRGTRPDFRIECWEFFVLWYMFVEINPYVLGLYDVKARRLGDSEKGLFILFERVTRFFNYPGGLQSYSDEEAAKAFQRLVRGYQKMPYFFKPKIAGSPSSELSFSRPSEVVTLKKLKDRREDIIEQSDGEFLDSYIGYRATVTGAFDGSALGHYYGDEWLKVPTHRMNVLQQWENIKRVITLNNGMTKYGTALVTSTVEHKTTADESASTVDLAEKIWDGSDWNDRDGNGMTKTGLVRVFRGYELNAPIDEYGFHKKEDARRHRENKVKSLMDSGDLDGLIQLKRKEPATIEDAFVKPTTNCPLHPQMCEVRLHQIKHGLDRWNKPGEKIEIIEGELSWKNRVGGDVQFTRKKGGKWNFSQMPFRENAITQRGSKYQAENMPWYRMAVDPFDSEETVMRGSDGAFTVFRRFNLLHEDQNKLRFNDRGEVENTWDMKTGQFVCDYKFRHQDPNDFYMDVILTAFFFGVQFYPEIDKPGLIQWAKNSGFKSLIQYEPPDLIAGLARKREARHGSKTTTHLVSNYVGLLSSHIARNIWAEKLPRLITQWMYFETAKRTKFDLAVASGWTMIADLEEQKIKQQQPATWGANSFYLNN